MPASPIWPTERITRSTPTGSGCGRSPALPPDDLVEAAAAGRKGGPGLLARGGMPDRDGTDRPVATGYAQGVHERLLALEYREEQGAQAEIDGGEKDQHHTEPGVDVPVRRGPVLLARQRGVCLVRQRVA